MHLSITYIVDKNLYTSHDVYVDSKWNYEKIIDWYEKRHSHINHTGITVTEIKNNETDEILFSKDNN